MPLQIPNEPYLLVKDEDAYKTFKECIAQLKSDIEAIQSAPGHMSIANEGMWSFFRSMLTGIQNTSLHIVNLFKTNLFRSYLTLKRTEIRYYNESNAYSMRSIFNSKYTDFADAIIPYPTGMKGKYSDAISQTNRSLAALDILTKAKLAVNQTDNIIQLLRDGTNLTSAVSEAATLLDPTAIRKQVSDTMKLFNTSVKVVPDKKFSELFSTMEEFRKTNDAALTSDAYVNQTTLAHKLMVECHENFESIIKQIEGAVATTVVKSDVEKFAVLAYNVAETFDMFASMLHCFHMIEHNLVEDYKELRRQFNL